MKKTIIKNLGTIVSGDISTPILDGDTICIDEDRITFIGCANNAPADDYDIQIDANGLTAVPGLIDAHAHVPLANYIDWYKAYDWVENFASSGVTSLVSVGGIRFPGEAKNRAEAIYQSIAARQLWENNHPCGSKIHAKSIMLYEGMERSDFAFLRKNGIYIVGEVGMSEVQAVDKIMGMVKDAHEEGFIVTAHCGGPSNRHCAMYHVDALEQIRPDVLCHVNGAPTPLSEEEIRYLVQSGKYFFDTVSNGNETLLVKIVTWAMEAGTLDKMMLGTNTPSVSGFSPSGLWIQMVICSHMTDLRPEIAVALGTGNVARCYGLDHGTLRVGKAADIVLTDSGSTAPGLLGTLKFGRIPSVGTVIVNGRIVLERGKNTAPVKHKPTIIRRGI